MSERKVYKLSDQIIGQVRELLQLSLLTRTHIVDNLRTLEVEESEEHPGKLILSQEYCEGWNSMVQKMYEEAQTKHDEQTSTLADDGEEESDSEELEPSEELN